MMAETIRPVFKLCASEQTSESKAQSHKWVQRNLDRTEQTSENRKFQRRAGRDHLSSGLQYLTLCCAHKDTGNRHKAEWQRERQGNKKEGYRAGVCEGLKEEEDTRIDKSTERWLKKKKKSEGG